MTSLPFPPSRALAFNFASSPHTSTSTCTHVQAYLHVTLCISFFPLLHLFSQTRQVVSPNPYRGGERASENLERVSLTLSLLLSRISLSLSLSAVRVVYATQLVCFTHNII